MATEDFDSAARHAFGFPPAVPDVAIGGMDLNRLALNSRAGRTGGAEVSWSITATRIEFGENSSVIVLIGDLQARREDWFAGCSVNAPLTFRENANVAPELDEEQLRDLCAWASNPMYDFAAMALRSVVAKSHACEIDLPVTTPKANLRNLKVEQTGDATITVKDRSS